MASAQYQQQGRQDSALYLNDLVSLPIIITDFDAESNNSKRSEEQESPQSPSSSAGDASLQRWATGFNDVADELWKSMTTSMRAKLREAAVEVLKRTDDTKSGAGGGGGELWGQWDEDARFLD